MLSYRDFNLGRNSSPSGGKPLDGSDGNVHQRVRGGLGDHWRGEFQAGPERKRHIRTANEPPPQVACRESDSH